MNKEKLTNPSKIQNKYFRWILIFMGTFFVGLGILGIILPVLPTTPFLLLAATCYAKSSDKFYSWLLNNRWFGSYIKNYREGNGIPLKIKIISVSLLWFTILCSTIFVINNQYIRILLILIAIGVSIHLIFIKSKHTVKRNFLKKKEIANQNKI